MLDITAPKVLTPSVLFLALTPGLLLQFPDTMKTSLNSVVVHALVFMAVYRIVACVMKMPLTPADLVVPATMFVLLSPGLLLSIPSSGPRIYAMLVHTLVFAVAFAFLRKTFPQFY